MFEFPLNTEKQSSDVVEANEKASTRSDACINLEDYRPALQQFLELKVSSQAAAMDLTQDTFEKFLLIENKDEIENVRSYLFSIAANLAKNSLRRERIYVVESDNDEISREMKTDEPDPEDWLIYTEMHENFTNILQALPEKCRDVFYLRRIRNFSSREIAEKYNISQRMVQKHLIKAIKHFHKYL